MAMRKGVGAADEETMRSLYDWMGEMTALHGVGVRLTIAPTKRVGVYIIKAQALEMADGKPMGIRVQYKQEWPTVKHGTLAGALLGTAMHLDHFLGMDGLGNIELKGE